MRLLPVKRRQQTEFFCNRLKNRPQNYLRLMIIRSLQINSSGYIMQKHGDAITQRSAIRLLFGKVNVILQYKENAIRLRITKSLIEEN